MGGRGDGETRAADPEAGPAARERLGERQDVDAGKPERRGDAGVRDLALPGVHGGPQLRVLLDRVDGAELASRRAKGSVAFVSAYVLVRATAPGMFATP